MSRTVANDSNRGVEFNVERRPKLRVLPCIDSTAHSDYFSALRAVGQIELLPSALPSTLGSRVESEQPDVIVIATERLAPSTWESIGSFGKLVSTVPTVLLVGEVNPSVRRRAARFDIRSVLSLDISTDQLRAAIHATMAGLAVTLRQDSLGEGENAGRSARDREFTEEPLAESLTARESDVLRLMARGHGNKEIATRLDISEHTAKFHVSSILGKLGATSRTEAVMIGIMRGLVAI